MSYKKILFATKIGRFKLMYFVLKRLASGDFKTKG